MKSDLRLYAAFMAIVLTGCSGSTLSSADTGAPDGTAVVSEAGARDSADTDGQAEDDAAMGSDAGNEAGLNSPCERSVVYRTGAACSSTFEGATCAGSLECGSVGTPQLELHGPVTCTGGTWSGSLMCPAPGGIAANGCPSMLPTNGATCMKTGTSCTYELQCSPPCDAGDPTCGSSGVGTTATCVVDTWRVNPLMCP